MSGKSCLVGDKLSLARCVLSVWLITPPWLLGVHRANWCISYYKQHPTYNRCARYQNKSKGHWCNQDEYLFISSHVCGQVESEKLTRF